MWMYGFVAIWATYYRNAEYQMQFCVFPQQCKQSYGHQECSIWLRRCGQAAVRDHKRPPAPAPAPESWDFRKLLQTQVAQKWRGPRGLQAALYSLEKVQVGEQQTWFQRIWDLFWFLHFVILHAQIVFSLLSSLQGACTSHHGFLEMPISVMFIV